MEREPKPVGSGKSIYDFLAPGAYERVVDNVDKHKKDGITPPLAFTMAFVEELVLLSVRNERAQESLLTEMEGRISKLESNRNGGSND